MPANASTSPNLGGPPKERRGRRPLLTVVAAVLLLGGLAFIATIPLQHGVARIVRSALAPHFTVESVRFGRPDRLDLHGVNGLGTQIRSVQIFIDPVKLLTRGVLAAIRRVELVEPHLALESGLAAFPDPVSPSAAAQPGALDDALSGMPFPEIVAAVRGGRALVGPLVIEFDAELRREGAEWIVTGSGTIAPDAAAPEAAAATGAFTLRGAWQPSSGLVRAEARAYDLETPYGALAEVRATLACRSFGEGCRTEFEGRDGRLMHHQLATLRGRVEQDLTGWRLAEAEGTASGGARYEASGHLYRNSAPGVDISIEATGVPLSEAVAWLGMPALQAAAESGEAAASVRIEGAPGALVSEGVVRIGRSTFAGVAVAGGDVHFRVGEGSVTADGALRLAGGGGALAGEIGESVKGVRAAVRFDDLPVPAVVQAARALGYAPWPEALSLAGRVSGSLHLDVGADLPATLAFELESERFTYRGASLAPLRAAGMWSPDGWQIEELALLGDPAGSTFVAGRGGGRTAQDFAFDLYWRGVSPDRLAPVLGEMLGRFQGESEGSLRVGAGAEGLAAQGELEGRFTVAGEPFDLRAAVRAPANAPIEVEGSVDASGGRLDFAGDWARNAAGGSLRAQLVAFPAPVLGEAAGLSGLRGAVSGQVQIGAAPSGWEAAAHLESPRVEYGGYALAGAHLSVELGAVPPAAEGVGESAACAECLWGQVTLRGAPGEGRRFADPVEWSAVFRGREAELLPASFPLAGGRVRLGGTARLESGEGWALTLESSGEGLRYRQAGVALDLDYRVALVGPALRPLLSGSVRVHSGEVDLFNLPRFGLGGRRTGSARAGVNFDLTAAVQEVRLIGRSLLDAEIAGELEVKGSAGEPQVYGALEARRGSFRYGQTLFTLERAAATFSGPPMAPRLDVVGTGRIGQEAVRVEVSGLASELSFSVAGPDGQPRSPGGDSALAAVGAGEWEEVGRRLVQWFGGELLFDAYWQLGRTLGDALDIDRFRIETDPETGGIALHLGKYVSDGLYLSYRRALARSSSSELGLEYTLTPGVRLHSHWEGPGGARLGAEARIPF